MLNRLRQPLKKFKGSSAVITPRLLWFGGMTYSAHFKQKAVKT